MTIVSEILRNFAVSFLLYTQHIIFMSEDKPGKPFYTIAIAVLILGLASLVPWGKLSNDFLKDYNLLADVFPGSIKVTAVEVVDPELNEAEAELNAETATTKEAQLPTGNENANQTPNEPSNGTSLYEVAQPIDPVNNVVDGVVIIEDYTVDGSGLKNLKRSLLAGGTTRIAVIGDSYIEGDILTADIREELQNRYGGSGVGYVPVSSQLTKFRQTVNQSCSGWTDHDIRKNARESMKTIQGEYFTAGGSASSTFKGSKNRKNLSSWDKSLVLAVAPNGGTVTLTTDNGTQTETLPAEDVVRAIEVNGTTTQAKVTASNGVEIVGVYLDGNRGVSLDNMSLRGNSGQSHRKLSIERAAQMRPYVDYDLIIVEYGINALESKRSNYDAYKELMKRTISRLRDCYPNADIIMMGIGDRGQKQGSEVHSVPTSSNMVKSQRDAARETGVLFWDTRQAMGGNDAVITWKNNKLINGDYIHLNAQGGKKLAEIFCEALFKAL